jgi:hypothetical protein
MMASDSLIVRCPLCGTKNRVPAQRWGDTAAVCGKCKAQMSPATLYPDRPVLISDGTFGREVLDFQGPVLVEFFAPW